MRPALAHLEGELVELERQGRLRVWRGSEPSTAGRSEVDARSNDYLGYGFTAPDGFSAPLGARGSRLVTGDHPYTRRLEDELADWTGHEASLVFSSGYAANVGLVAALAGPADLVVSDERNHASLIDGCRLSRATVRVVRHGDVDGVRRAVSGAGYRRRWVLMESYYSMDGTLAPVAALREICDAKAAGLIVDEAHALGVFGPSGSGACAMAGVAPDVLVGTFGKALGAQGAFVAGDRVLVRWLWNRCRSFVYSTGISPWLASGVLANLGRARADELGRDRLKANYQKVRAGLASAGIAVAEGSVGPIIPVLVGGDDECVRYELRLRERGVLAKAIRPPTVPVGTARLRVTVHARMSASDVERLVDALVECLP